MKNQCLCIATVNGNRQCSRKGKTEFGNLCGLHYNFKLKHDYVPTIELVKKKNYKNISIKKKQESIFIDSILSCDESDESDEILDENNNLDNNFEILFKGNTDYY